MKVLVLAGGPDRERAVSLLSGAVVAAALREAGHEVVEGEASPRDLTALDHWRGEVVFPAMHGPWGEGGPLQAELDRRGLAYVGCRTAAASLCMDKLATKAVLREQGIATPAWAEVLSGDAHAVTAWASDATNLPCVLKPVCEGSSFGMLIADTPDQLLGGYHEIKRRYDRLLVERYIKGPELTVGVVAGLEGQGSGGSGGGGRGLPPIWIRPDAAFYDYQAKYESDATRYLFDLAELNVDPAELQRLAVSVHAAVGARHLSRVDLMLDAAGKPWVLEVNTMPGFTTHSLLPMAAKQAGVPLPALVDHLVRLAAEEN